ncbi:hypothetical protein [Nocardioides sp. MH1]|uniref:hypothetical protein n=1 Tax=Nocardioides sp. MH1 TaxID=3242490 RepID=UPI003520C13A
MGERPKLSLGHGKKGTDAPITLRAAVVAVIVLALFGFAGERALSWQDSRNQLDDQKAAAAAASAEVEGLIDISGSTSEKDMARLLDGATADFRSELEGQATRLQKLLADNEVKATGEVVSTGIVKFADDKATVIVAATGTVQNRSTKEAEPRSYRLKVDLVRSDDKWLVSGLEFVA